MKAARIIVKLLAVIAGLIGLAWCGFWFMMGAGQLGGLGYSTWDMIKSDPEWCAIFATCAFLFVWGIVG